eukprot:762521-Hanusia_phi.AAC.43
MAMGYKTSRKAPETWMQTVCLLLACICRFAPHVQTGLTDFLDPVFNQQQPLVCRSPGCRKLGVSVDLVDQQTQKMSSLEYVAAVLVLILVPLAVCYCQCFVVACSKGAKQVCLHCCENISVCHGKVVKLKFDPICYHLWGDESELIEDLRQEICETMNLSKSQVTIRREAFSNHAVVLLVKLLCWKQADRIFKMRTGFVVKENAGEEDIDEDWRRTRTVQISHVLHQELTNEKGLMRTGKCTSHIREVLVLRPDDPELNCLICGRDRSGCRCKCDVCGDRKSACAFDCVNYCHVCDEPLAMCSAGKVVLRFKDKELTDKSKITDLRTEVTDSLKVHPLQVLFAASPATNTGEVVMQLKSMRSMTRILESLKLRVDLGKYNVCDSRSDKVLVQEFMDLYHKSESASDESLFATIESARSAEDLSYFETTRKTNNMLFNSCFVASDTQYKDQDHISTLDKNLSVAYVFDTAEMFPTNASAQPDTNGKDHDFPSFIAKGAREQSPSWKQSRSQSQGESSKHGLPDDRAVGPDEMISNLPGQAEGDETEDSPMELTTFSPNDPMEDAGNEILAPMPTVLPFHLPIPKKLMEASPSPRTHRAMPSPRQIVQDNLFPQDWSKHPSEAGLRESRSLRSSYSDLDKCERSNGDDAAGLRGLAGGLGGEHNGIGHRKAGDGAGEVDVVWERADDEDDAGLRGLAAGLGGERLKLGQGRAGDETEAGPGAQTGARAGAGAGSGGEGLPRGLAA